MKIRIEDIGTFVAVVNENGFIAGSKRLGLAKSAVSKRIADIEARVGARLIQRSTRSFCLTEAGRIFYDRAIQLLEDFDNLENFAHNNTGQLTGKLRVSSPMSFGIQYLSPLFGKFLSQHEQLQIDLDFNDRMVDVIAEGYDLAVRISRMNDSSLVARKITRISHVTVASPAYLEKFGTPKRPRDLVKHKGVIYSNVDEQSYWRYVTTNPDDNVKASDIRSVFRVNNGEALREVAIAGCGIAALPTFIVHNAVREGKLKVILKGFEREPIDLYAVYPSRKNLPLKVRTFVDFLQKEFQSGPYWEKDVFGKG
ncbi:MAG TPA: LysR family transcriptional regulator [Oligoflexus sp.]|uniref:LysR family transcriptional regulator n=1 Tax=Oligoflexus sp. TaxID=1971216 RepID=UPI002D7E6D38|nr:LysR family transcriptional regulator [Oligoflexus sp.]HET9236211.1 LysR family transcriptional regulator [Oligoflexus sp.]